MLAAFVLLMSPAQEPVTRCVDLATISPKALRALAGRTLSFRVVIDSLPEKADDWVWYEAKGGDASNYYSVYLRAETDKTEVIVRGRVEVIWHRPGGVFPAYDEYRLVASP